MSKIIITIDIDWASEQAIEETIAYFIEKNIPITVFSTHNSRVIESFIDKIDIGLHPYFSSDSSQGKNINDVVKFMMDLPHNIQAYRCHRFAVCNSSKQAMLDAGMIISSNVCTDLEVIPAFRDRFGIIEVPIFLEDGGYLWRKHKLELSDNFTNKILNEGTKIITIHPMHFVLNTPNFEYMFNIKNSLSRYEWNNMSKPTINQLKWNGRGIRDLIIDIMQLKTTKETLRSYIKLS